MNSREKTLAAVQKALVERGYVVIGIKPGFDTRYKIGEIVRDVCAVDLGQPFQIVAETNAEDWIAQCKLVGAEVNYTNGEAFYRAVTD
jgi:hypothetical protein